jgi:hypothetical protein
MIERERINFDLGKAAFADIASGYGEESQRSPGQNLSLAAD